MQTNVQTMKNTLSNLGVVLFTIIVVFVSCQRQKMKEPPKEFTGARFSMKTAEQRNGPFHGVTYLVTTYGLEVVVEQVELEKITVKFPVNGVFETFSLPIENVHSGFVSGQTAYLTMEYRDMSPDAKWEYHLNLKK